MNKAKDRNYQSSFQKKSVTQRTKYQLSLLKIFPRKKGPRQDGFSLIN